MTQRIRILKKKLDFLQKTFDVNNLPPGSTVVGFKEELRELELTIKKLENERNKVQSVGCFRKKNVES